MTEELIDAFAHFVSSPSSLLATLVVLWLRAACLGCCADAARLVFASSRGRKQVHAVRPEAFPPGGAH